MISSEWLERMKWWHAKPQTIQVTVGRIEATEIEGFYRKEPEGRTEVFHKDGEETLIGFVDFDEKRFYFTPVGWEPKERLTAGNPWQLAGMAWRAYYFSVTSNTPSSLSG